MIDEHFIGKTNTQNSLNKVLKKLHVDITEVNYSMEGKPKMYTSPIQFTILKLKIPKISTY